MKHYSIVCVSQIYNELEKGNLKRFFKYAIPLFDAMVVYDDHSTDGSYEYICQHTPFVIRGKMNDFLNEMKHKQLLLEEALKLKPDYLFWLDADEVVSRHGAKALQQLCAYCDINKIDGIQIKELNIWRSNIWARTDSLYDEGWFVRLWRVTSDIKYEKCKKGLHMRPYPSTIKKIDKTNMISILHYGFANEKNLAYKYITYRSHGQEGYYMLDRLISEEHLILEKIPADTFPHGLYVEEKAPKPLRFNQSLKYVEKYKEEILRPTYSIICLIYNSIEWLKFVYEQVHKYTDLSNKEFFFIANDASDEVLQYLKDYFIPHYIFNNTKEQKKEWFINNVYRAYNYGAQKAKGDYLIFINSDMAFSENWLENLVEHYYGNNCLVPRLVESGKLRTGTFGIEKNFGKKPSEYKEKEFLNYVKKIAREKVLDGGLFMPLFIKKQDFDRVGGYPEGNIRKDSDIFAPVIAHKGEDIITGDKVLVLKLEKVGIKHQTVFNSIVYHFQCGEIDSKEVNEKYSHQRIALCNDLLNETMGEKVLWNYLIENIPSIVGIDKRLVGENGVFEQKLKKYIKKNLPDVCMIIQNASFMNPVEPMLFTISFLQDNLRGMERDWNQQKRVLEISDKKVANSNKTASNYPEYSFSIIPIGIDSILFHPMQKEDVRSEMDIPNDRRIGIFVGNFSNVKGWDEIIQCIKTFPEIYWILVTKYDENYSAPNVRVFQKVDQITLSKLYNCADFFIIGSRVETQCLAALEACLCDIPIIMHPTGIFMDWRKKDRDSVGIFTDDLIYAVKNIPSQIFSPRETVLSKGYSIQETVSEWKKLIEENMQASMQQKYNHKLIIRRQELIEAKEKKLKYEEDVLKEKITYNIFKRKVQSYIKVKSPKLYSILKRLLKR